MNCPAASAGVSNVIPWLTQIHSVSPDSGFRRNYTKRNERRRMKLEAFKIYFRAECSQPFDHAHGL
jgi:hypothetical protein